MEISLDRITDEPFHWQEKLTIPVETLDRPELDELSEISCQGRVAAIDEGYLLEARLAYEQKLVCVRCLTPFVDGVEREIELRVVSGGPEVTLGEIELSEQDLTLLNVDDEILETTPIILEQLQLNIPMRALCREDCAGLCPVCGNNRNDQPCQCEDQQVDPRWEVLKEWQES
jgi:uncharacterized protein